MSSSLRNTQLLVGRSAGYSSNYTADISGSLYCASGCILAASGGNVGIGTTSPAYNLDIYNSTANAIPLQLSSPISGGSSQSYLQLTSGTYGARIGAGIIQGTGAFMTFNQGSGSTFSESMRIQGSNVGIGTTNPAQLLDITNTTGAANIRLCSQTSAGYITSNYNAGVNSYVGIYSGVASTSALGTPQFVVSNNNYVGIGTTNPGYPLDVNGIINCNNLFRVTNGLINTSLHYDRIQFQTGGSGPFYILNSNSVGVRLDNGTTSWAAQSDGRLKNIIEPITDAISKIDKLNPVIYSWISDASNTRQVGLIAQDVLKVQPECVSVDPNDGYLGVRYTELIPLAFAGIKEQKVIIQTQQSQIQALQTENTDLKSRLASIESRLTTAGF